MDRKKRQAAKRGKGKTCPAVRQWAAGFSGWAMEKRHETCRDSFMFLFFCRIQHGSMRRGKGTAPKVNGFFSANETLLIREERK